MDSVYNSSIDALPGVGEVIGILPRNKETSQENAPELLNSKEEDDSSDYKLSLSEQGWKVFEDKDKDEDLSEEEQRQIEELQKIDRKVRTHEQAHLNAAGGYARGGANYDYVTGPDGKRYAKSGHVNLDTGKERTPEATIRKADIIKKAALAPADPSPADKQIAAEATKMAVEAQKELVVEQQQQQARQAS
jgi:hypothetical protein